MATTKKPLIKLMELTLVFACVMQGLAQPGRAQSLKPATASAIQQENAYRIKPGDTIKVEVEGAPELSCERPVDSAGAFLMPYLGRIRVQQLTGKDLADLIADGLRGYYLKDPKVTVKVVAASVPATGLYPNGRDAFFIMGAVKKPGVYQIEGRPTLLKLLTLAGGIAENHGPTAYIMRERKPQNALPDAAHDQDLEYDTIQVDISRRFKGFLSSMRLEPGDVVNIPIADIFYVAGEVFAPGSFPFTEDTTLRQAIALAQGVTFAANTKEGVIFRTDPATGYGQEIKVDIAAVMRGKAPDIPLQPNDVILVPNIRPRRLNDVFRRLDNPLPPVRPPCRGKEPCIT